MVVFKVQTDNSDELEALHVFHMTLVEMNDEFKAKLIRGYGDDRAWRRVMDLINANDKLSPNAATLSFEKDHSDASNSTGKEIVL